MGRHLSTRDGYVPAIGLFGDRDCLGRPFYWTAPVHRDTPDLGEDEGAVIQPRPVAVFLEGEGAVAIAALEAGEPRPLTALHAPEERLIRLVQPRQHILQDVAVDVRIGWKLSPDLLHLGFLLEPGDGDVAPLPGSNALLQ